MRFDDIRDWLIEDYHVYDVEKSDNGFARAAIRVYGGNPTTGSRGDALMEIIEDAAHGYMYVYSMHHSEGTDRYVLWRPHKGRPYRPWRVYAHPTNRFKVPPN